MPRASQHREVSKTTQAWGSTRAAWCRARQFFHFGGCGRQGRHLLCKQSHAGALPAISTTFRELSRLADCKSAVKKPVGRRPVEHYHQLPPFITPTPWVPKPKSSRRTVVNRVINECKSRRDRHGSNLPQARGRQLIRSAWNREIPGAAPGCLTTFPPCSSGVERVTSNRTVAGAIPAGEISQVSK